MGTVSDYNQIYRNVIKVNIYCGHHTAYSASCIYTEFGGSNRTSRLLPVGLAVDRELASGEV